MFGSWESQDLVPSSPEWLDHPLDMLGRAHAYLGSLMEASVVARLANPVIVDRLDPLSRLGLVDRHRSPVPASSYDDLASAS